MQVRRLNQLLSPNVFRMRLKGVSRRWVRELATQSLGLAGTAPYHNIYLFLHSATNPQTFPSVVSSPLQKALQLKLTPLRGYVNFSWDPTQPTAKSNDGSESYSATVFSKDRGPLEIDGITLSNLDAVIDKVTMQPPITAQDKTTYLYVCTHGARDCRCGETGGQVATALREEINRRHLSSTVKLGETGHVGGHQYAANLLVYPHGEWLGNVTPDNVPAVLDAIIAQPTSAWDSQSSPMLVPSNWRGRMGLDKEEQSRLHASSRSQP